jgi:CRISPR-associated protein Csb3
MTTIQLAVDARNPGEYLAVCGLLELVGRVDPASGSAWTRRAGLVPDVPLAATDVCEIESSLDEAQVARELGIALGDRSAWRAVTAAGRVPLADSIGTWTAGIEVVFPSQDDVVVIDHWYESAFVSGDEIVQRQGKRDGKGRWKFWAGQQDTNKGITGLVLDLVDSAARMSEAKRFQDLLIFASPGGGRLNLDAATTRSSIDRGISANDAAASGGSPGRPVLELLAAIGLSAFFPPRRFGDLAPDGTVGVNRRVFTYCTWSPSAPLSIARLAARGVDIASFEQERREATIGMMSHYSHLKFARPAGVTEVDVPDDVSSEEEEDSHE